MQTVLYRGEPITKIVDLAFCPHQLARIEPSIVLDNEPLAGNDDTYTYIQLDCIPLEAPEKRFLLNGYLGYVDPIVAWHTIQLLKEVEVLKSRRSLHILISAAMRGACEQDMREALDILKYGISSYNAAMAQQVPTSIIDSVLRCHEFGTNLEGCKRTITSEIEVGTMQLTPELREAGVHSPEYYDACKKKHDEIMTTRYKEFEALYKPFVPENWQDIVGWHILACIERGIEDTHGTRIVAMLAVLRAIRMWDGEDERVNGLHYQNHTEGRPTLEQRVGEIIGLLSHDTDELLQDFDAFGALVEKIIALYESIDTLPIIHELVAID